MSILAKIPVPRKLLLSWKAPFCEVNRIDCKQKSALPRMGDVPVELEAEADPEAGQEAVADLEPKNELEKY